MGPEVGEARSCGGGAVAYEARRRLRQRDRRAAAAAQGAGPRAGRRGHHHAVHVLRDRGRHPQRRRHAGLRGHRSRRRSTSRPAAVEAAITPRTRGHRRGRTCSARWPRWKRSCRSPRGTGSPLIEDAAQSIGARRKMDGDVARWPASCGTVGTLSFFPQKNLGAYGDGGMMVTQDDALADRLRRLRLHGGAQAVLPRRGRLQQPARYAAGGRAAGQAAAPRRLERGARAQRARATPRRSRAIPTSARPTTDPANEQIFNQYTIRVAAARRAAGAPQGAAGSATRSTIRCRCTCSRVSRTSATPGQPAGVRGGRRAGHLAAGLSRAHARRSRRRSSTPCWRSTLSRCA